MKMEEAPSTHSRQLQLRLLFVRQLSGPGPAEAVEGEAGALERAGSVLGSIRQDGRRERPGKKKLDLNFRLFPCNTDAPIVARWCCTLDLFLYYTLCFDPFLSVLLLN